MHITPEAVEAAARAEYEHIEKDGWDNAHPDDRRDYRIGAGVALEAALPYLIRPPESTI